MAARWTRFQPPATAESGPLRSRHAIGREQPLDRLIAVVLDRSHCCWVQHEPAAFFPQEKDGARSEAKAGAHPLGKGDLTPWR